MTGLAAGSSTITASSGGVSAQVVVTVIAAQSFVLTQVNAGPHTCGLTVAGAAWCWGRNLDGEIGDGTTVQRARPVPVAGGQVFSQIVVGLQHTCARTGAGAVWCWGRNVEGQLGDGSFLMRNQPVQVQVPFPLAEITAGSLHTCGRATSGQVWCWGDNRFGQLGDGSLSVRNQATPVLGGLIFVQISAGQDRTCGVIAAGQAWCWGSNGGTINPLFTDAVGILGVGSTASPITQPMQVVGNIQWAEVSAGYRFACGRTPASVVRCWGANTYVPGRGGQVGDGSLAPRIQPVLIATGAQTFTRVGAGFFSACALDTVGEAWCWGTNFAGEVGDGGLADFPTSVHHPTPIKIVGGLRFVSLNMAKLNACGLTAAGDTWCWGSNAFGQIGDGTTTSRSSPVRVTP